LRLATAPPAKGSALRTALDTQYTDLFKVTGECHANTSCCRF